MFRNILGCGESNDTLLWFFLLLVVFSCFCGGDENGLLGGFGGFGGNDNLLFFFLLLVLLFCMCGNNEDGCGC